MNEDEDGSPVCAKCGDNYTLREHSDPTEFCDKCAHDVVDALRAENERLRGALGNIQNIGGNLPDERLTDRTGPNDAAARGLMYCAARDMARAALEEKQ